MASFVMGKSKRVKIPNIYGINENRYTRYCKETVIFVKKNRNFSMFLLVYRIKYDRIIYDWYESAIL